MNASMLKLQSIKLISIVAATIFMGGILHSLIVIGMDYPIWRTENLDSLKNYWLSRLALFIALSVASYYVYFKSDEAVIKYKDSKYDDRI